MHIIQILLYQITIFTNRTNILKHSKKIDCSIGINFHEFNTNNLLFLEKYLGDLTYCDDPIFCNAFPRSNYHPCHPFRGLRFHIDKAITNSHSTVILSILKNKHNIFQISNKITLQPSAITFFMSTNVKYQVLSAKLATSRCYCHYLRIIECCLLVYFQCLWHYQTKYKNFNIIY